MRVWQTRRQEAHYDGPPIEPCHYIWYPTNRRKTRGDTRIRDFRRHVEWLLSGDEPCRHPDCWVRPFGELAGGHHRRDVDRNAIRSNIGIALALAEADLPLLRR